MYGGHFCKSCKYQPEILQPDCHEPGAGFIPTITLAKEIPAGMNLSGFCVRYPFDRNRRGISKPDIQRVNPIRQQTLEEKQKPWNPRHG